MFNILPRQTIITTALPTIVKDFEASTAGYTWIGSAYLLAAAGALPLRLGKPTGMLTNC